MNFEYNIEFKDNDKEYKEWLDSNSNLFNWNLEEPPTHYNIKYKYNQKNLRVMNMIIIM